MNADARRRFHSLTGLVPLGAYLLFHTWEHWPIRTGRDAALARLAGTQGTLLEVLFVLVPLLAHAALGVSLHRTPDATRAYASPAFRRLQAVTGGITLAFLLWHVPAVWGPRVVSGDAARAYDAMQAQAGTALGAGLHVLALSAVCVHLGQGLAAAWLRHKPEAPVRFVRGLGIALGLALWLMLVNELSAYAGGAPLL